MKMKCLLFMMLFFAAQCMNAQETPKSEEFKMEVIKSSTNDSKKKAEQAKAKGNVSNLAAPTPPPPPPPPMRKKKIFKVVEDMPRFKTENCEELPKSDRNTCATKSMLSYIYANLEYPPIAKENGVDGTVVINFTVAENGEIKDAKIARDIGAGCGQEALRIVNSMPNWIAGKQRGEPVAVYFNLPVKFKIEDAKE